MSFLSSSSPREADVDGRRHGGGRGKKAEDAEEEEKVPALDMLDDFWFFSNSLGGRDEGKGVRKPPLLPKSPSTSSSSAGAGRTKSAGASGSDDQPQGSKSRFYDASGGRRLLRTPSLPSPHIGMEQSSEVVEEDAGGDQAQAAEAEDDDMNWSKIYEGVLRTRIAEEGRGSSSPLHRAPSTPVHSYGRETPAGAVTRSTPSLPRLRHSHSTLDSHCRSHTPTKPDRMPRTTGGSGSRAERGQPRRELRSFGANQHPAALARAKSEFQDKKWKSSSALESIEVQGFKDLGFVFDQEELRESLADVLPGLRDSSGKAKSSGSGSVSVSGSGSASDNDDASGIGIGDATRAGGSDAGDGVVRRPYLSEAWQHGARSAPQTSASAIRLQQRSAAEMKDQIRMWAQAVACNARQEC